MEKIVEGFVPLFAAQEMRGQDALVFAQAVGEDHFHGLPHPAVQLFAARRQQALVDAITDPVKAQADVAQADAIRNKTMQIFAARKAAGTKKS